MDEKQALQKITPLALDITKLTEDRVASLLSKMIEVLSNIPVDLSKDKQSYYLEEGLKQMIELDSSDKNQFTESVMQKALDIYNIGAKTPKNQDVLRAAFQAKLRGEHW